MSTRRTGKTRQRKRAGQRRSWRVGEHWRPSPGLGRHHRDRSTNCGVTGQLCGDQDAVMIGFGYPGGGGHSVTV